MQIFTHGSEDSLDHDTYAIFDSIPTFQEAKIFCEQQSELGYNANILVVQDGQVIWCFKGTEDECNNSLLKTYPLHIQNFECPILHSVKRNLDLKVLRTIRGLLSYFSRTEIRALIKKSLKSNDLNVKIEALEICELTDDTDFQKNSKIEVFKFFAFQIGQTKGLINGIELFTKSDVANLYPTLRPYLYREDVPVENLNDFFKEFKIELSTALLSIKNIKSIMESDQKSKF